MRTLLISDLHLQEERPDITRAFLYFLDTEARSADALYILGDFFEVWVGDDAITPFQHEVACALRQLSERGVALFLMHGNRDFLLGRGFCRLAGCTLLQDPSIVELAGRRVLLMHGDTLCTRDEAYMRLRRWLRNPLTLFVLRHLPLSVRLKLARQLRNQSRASTRLKAADIVDVTPVEVEDALRKARVPLLIHGHTHRPAVHAVQLGDACAERIVLGDWERQGWFVEADEQQVALKPFAFA